MLISLVLAMATDGTIGDRGTLPWRLPSDLERFKKITQGGTVIMGRKTWDSLPEKFKPLPGRQNIVLTRGHGDDIAQRSGVVAASMQHALSLASQATYVIGGAEIYKLFLPVAQRAYITRVYGDFGGDTRLDEHGLFRLGDWRVVVGSAPTSTERGRHHPADTHDSEFYTLVRT